MAQDEYPDKELLYDIVRLAKELGKELTEADINAYGVATATIYEQRWGSFARAREEAYQSFGTPLVVAIYRQWVREMQESFPSLLKDS